MRNLKNYLILMRFNKPIGILLLLWPTLTSLWLANNGAPSLKLLIIFTLGTIITRSMGCVVNDLIDYKFDKHVARTKNRPLVTGLVSKSSAKVLVLILAILAFCLVLLTNLTTIGLSFLALTFACIYPTCKRFTNFPQFMLGVAFAMAIPMAYTASCAPINASMWIIFGATVVWAVIYDTIYAMQDLKDDLKIGVKSTAIIFGDNIKNWIFSFQLIYLSCYIMLGFWAKFGLSYYLGLGLIAGLFGYQQYLLLNSSIAGDPKYYFKAFINNNWVGLILFINILLNLS